jgi:hypothetical protein
VTERLAVVALALLTLLSLWLAPWAALNRETGARSAVMLLPNRIVDFTTRTTPVEAPGQGVVLLLSVLGTAAIIGGGALRDRPRQVLWLAAGATLLVDDRLGARAASAPPSTTSGCSRCATTSAPRWSARAPPSTSTCCRPSSTTRPT